MSNQNWFNRLLKRDSSSTTTKTVTSTSNTPATENTSNTKAMSSPPLPPWTEGAEDDPYTEEDEPVEEQPSTTIPSAEANVPPTWQRGDVILDQYEVTGNLGEGGMGTVYQVHHRGWNIDMAVKNPRPEIFTREEGKENFIREAETWVNLDLHPHIVSCYYVRTLGNIPRIFAEYVDGGSLSDWIRRHRLYAGNHKEALQRMLDIAIQFAWGLHAAHEQGLVHQDIKPANVMMTQQGIAKVTDFGLAKARALVGNPSTNNDANAQQSILVTGRGLTPAYSSPEQAAGQPLSRKTDIWSWGVSILEMFVGEVTWRSGMVARDVLASHTPAHEAIPPMPSELVKLLVHCFEPQAQQRPATMQEIVSVLKEIYAHEIGQPYPRSEPQTAKMLADSLNNRALSLYDLGKIDEAKETWEKTLQADPQHLETTYNRGLVLWRLGELTDDALLHQLEILQQLNESWQVAAMIAQIHMERGDITAAKSLLEDARQEASEVQELADLLQRIPTDNTSYFHVTHTAEHHPETYATSINISTDGNVALSGETIKIQEKTTWLHRIIWRLWETTSGRDIYRIEKEFHRKFGEEYGDLSDIAIYEYVSLSGDGRLAFSKVGTELRLWEATTGRELRTFKGHTSTVEKVALSADGQWTITSGQHDQIARFWNASTGRCYKTFLHEKRTSGMGNSVKQVSLSADGSIAITADTNQIVRIWETATGRCLYLWDTHKPFLNDELSGKISTGSVLMDSYLSRSGNVFYKNEELNDDRVTSVSLSGDGTLALYSKGSKIYLYDVVDGQHLDTLEGHTGEIAVACFSADGRWIISGGTDATVRLWDAFTGRCLHTFTRHKNRVLSISTSSNGRRIVSSGADKTIQLWEKHDGPILSSSLRPSLVSSYSDVAQVETQAEALLQQVEQAISQSQFTTALSLLNEVQALPNWRRNQKTRNTWAKLLPHSSRTRFISGWPVNTIQAHARGVNSISVSSDGTLALSVGNDGTASLWDLLANKDLMKIRGDKGSITSCFLTKDGTLLLWGTNQGFAYIWDIATNELKLTFGENSRMRAVFPFRINVVGMSVDKRWAFSSDRVGAIEVWDTQTGKKVHTLFDYTRPEEYPDPFMPQKIKTRYPGSSVAAICPQPNGNLLATGSYNQEGNLRIWDVETGNCLLTMEGHKRAATSLDWSTDGQLIATGGRDDSDGNYAIRLWEVSTGRCLCTIEDTGEITSVRLSNDGRWIFSGGGDGTIRVWEIMSDSSGYTGRCVYTFKGHSNSVNSIGLSADNRWLVSGSSDETIRCWELDWELSVTRSLSS